MLAQKAIRYDIRQDKSRELKKLNNVLQTKSTPNTSDLDKFNTFWVAKKV